MKTAFIYCMGLFLLQPFCHAAEQPHSAQLQKIIALSTEIDLHTIMLKTVNDSPYAGHTLEPCVKENIMNCAKTLERNLEERRKLIQQLSESDLLAFLKLCGRETKKV